jgi:hypothetical protein
VVTVQSARIGAERRGFNPSSVRQFLVRIGEETGRLSTADCSSELRVRNRITIIIIIIIVIFIFIIIIITTDCRSFWENYFTLITGPLYQAKEKNQAVSS